MIGTRKTILLVSLLAAVAAPAAALTPAEVLVVANDNVPDSVELARHYLQIRSIPADNLVLIKTTDDDAIARPDYAEQILKPIRDALAARPADKPIRCICLMWGVPVRLENTDQLQPKELMQFYVAEAKRVRIRIAIDRQLISRIGRDFTPPQVRHLEPVGKLFADPAPRAPQKLPSVPAIRKNIETDLRLTTDIVNALTEKSQQRTAMLQMLGMQLELYGLRGLIDFVETHKPDILADPAPYQEHLKAAETKLAELLKDLYKQTPDEARIILAWKQRSHGAMGVADYVQKQVRRLNPGRSIKADASVDSELATLAFNGMPKAGFAYNPLHVEIAQRNIGARLPTIMTCRIDGPSAADARRIIDDSVAVEAEGLRGIFYIDAGMPPRFQSKPSEAYRQQDEQLRTLAANLKKGTSLKVVLDLQPEVFRPNTCPNAGLYLGWYSLRSYVPAFQWSRGAVAYHVASFEAMNLRDPKTNEWCAKLIQNGVVATLGAVNEPGLTAFPDHQAFFLMLLAGKNTVAECYWRTQPLTSWQMTLIADPLYTPFKVNPRVDADSLQGLIPPADWPPAYRPPAVTTAPESPDKPATPPVGEP
ncbi:MAG: TIGR03790 family protein [Planctomycetota bacterium]|jgi:uncharacterized protein (TIGR03790 family)